MRWILKILGIAAIVALGFVVFGYATMYLWNWIMPYLFHLPPVDFTMAIGLVLLSKILFGGMRMRGGHHGWKYRNYWRNKCENMSPEEREKFKTEFAERCRHKWGRADVNVEKSE
jgi:hypothetical protein